MNEERRDVGLFIGLHKLAEQNGDGLVPELYALLTARAEAAANMASDMTNVVTFPADLKSHASGMLPAGEGRVLAFRR
ncbi:hypothetical protein QTA58_16390 [Neorhizobium sp. CSC1952]|uniref:hypothetical protein n=1 Tax=Neorhizobium sp. CSC1952 TaxID=2978974 RepID=UPI0025A5BE81|nr:hypothetical protein [Rhizobium sp. CSC1952]WJR65799.1 hypothetical protein QTA58_16390 [Rhizobium sp. CSC1952]